MQFGAVFKHTNGLCDVEITGFDGLDLAALTGWNHDLVNDGLGFLDVADNLAARHFIALGDLRLKRPGLFHVKRIGIDTTGDEHTHDFLKGSKRSLDTVVNLGQEAGAQGNGQRLFGVQHGFAGPNTRGVFVHLDNSLVAVQFNHFTHQTFMANTHNVIHCSVHARGGYDRSRNSVNHSFIAHFFFLLFLVGTSLPQIDSYGLTNGVSQGGVFLRTDAEHGWGDGCRQLVFQPVGQRGHHSGVDHHDTNGLVVE